MSLIFVIGGARSGKSTFAELKAKEYSENVLYIATAAVTDEAMADRVKSTGSKDRLSGRHWRCTLILKHLLIKLNSISLK